MKFALQKGPPYVKPQCCSLIKPPSLSRGRGGPLIVLDYPTWLSVLLFFPLVTGKLSMAHVENSDLECYKSLGSNSTISRKVWSIYCRIWKADIFFHMVILKLITWKLTTEDLKPTIEDREMSFVSFSFCPLSLIEPYTVHALNAFQPFCCGEPFKGHEC